MTRLAQAVAIAIGEAGAMFEVSTYAKLDAGVDRSWGRKSEFDDARPGVFSFVLDNTDGRFTPGNTTAARAAGYSTALTEGLSVCWQLGTRVVAGTIQGLEPAFPSGESAWAQVRVTVDDLLGNAARKKLTGLTDALFDVSGGIGLWPLNDEPGLGGGVQTRGVGNSLMAGRATFGVTTSHIPVEESVVLVDASTELYSFLKTPQQAYEVPAATLTMGGWGLWVERVDDTSVFYAAVVGTGLSGTGRFEIWADSTSTRLVPNSGSTITSAPIPPGTAHYLSYSSGLTLTTNPYPVSVSFFVDGVTVGTTAAGTIDYYNRTQTIYINPRHLAGWVGTSYVSRISHTFVPPNEFAATAASMETRIGTIASVVPLALPGFVSTPTTGNGTVGTLIGFDGTALDALNSVIEADQGHIYTQTGGSLLAPLPGVYVRSRDRTPTVAYSFNAETEAQGSTDFIRDLADLVDMATADGTASTATYIDTTLSSRASGNSTSESLPFRDYIELYMWASDRVWRGSNVGLRPVSLTVDAFTTPTNRSTDLLALTPGDRIRITGLPSTQLGFSTWDGWLLGVDEEHNETSHKFTLYMSPALLATALFDDQLFMANGCLSLSAAITTAVATSMSVSTTGALLETVDVPYTLIVDSEQVTVTACTSGTPQVATITRGVNGTTATTHTTSATIEVSGFVTSYNPIVNPSPQLTATGYFVSGAALTGARTAAVGVGGGFGYRGTFSAPSATSTDGLAIGSSTDLSVPVVAGQVITPNFYVGSSIAPTISIRYAFYDVTNTIVGAFVNDTVTTTLVAGAALVRHVASPLTVPAAATHMVIRAIWATGTNWTTSSTLTVDRFSLDPHAYYDGATTATSTETYSWLGSAYASGSKRVSTVSAAASLFAY